MPDVWSFNSTGDWRIVVVSRDADWQQRVVVDQIPSAPPPLAGNGGNSTDVVGVGDAIWRLRVQHNDGSGWRDSLLRPGLATITGAQLTQVIGSEDSPGQPNEDFNDLIIRLEKLGMAEQPTQPFAVLPSTLQMMPEGIFEATLGRYFMAVRVQNIWTLPWPAGAMVGISARCRAWLAGVGVAVVDNWSAAEADTIGQTVTGGLVEVGPLAPWTSTLVYFKVDVSSAAPGKHPVEVEVLEPAAEDIDHINRKARAPMMVSRTVFDSTTGAFVSTVDRGVMTAAIKELVVDYHSFKRAIGAALDGYTSGFSGGTGAGGTERCDPGELDRLRDEMRTFLDGKEIDLCDLVDRIRYCCRGGQKPPGDGGDWTRGSDPLAFFAFPTIVDYSIAYRPPFSGQYGPIPFDDPWWKILLAIIAIILTLVAAASAALDLANKGSDVLIGTVRRAVLNALPAQPAMPPATTDAGSVDAAVVALNGNRSLTTSIFSYLDAAAGEANTTPIGTLGGRIDTAGTIVTNAEIDTIFANLLANPGDPAAQDAVKVFKSGARTGLTLGIMQGVTPISPRAEEDGSIIFFLNQISFAADPAQSMTIARPGDSGSIWQQRGTNRIVALNHMGCSAANSAGGTRIEDVMNAVGIRFG